MNQKEFIEKAKNTKATFENYPKLVFKLNEYRVKNNEEIQKLLLDNSKLDLLAAELMRQYEHNRNNDVDAAINKLLIRLG